MEISCNTCKNSYIDEVLDRNIPTCKTCFHSHKTPEECNMEHKALGVNMCVIHDIKRCEKMQYKKCSLCGGRIVENEAEGYIMLCDYLDCEESCDYCKDMKIETVFVHKSCKKLKDLVWMDDDWPANNDEFQKHLRLSKI